MVRLPEVTGGTRGPGGRGLVLLGFTLTSSCSVSWPPAQNPRARESHRICVSELWGLCQLSTWWVGHRRCLGSGIAKGLGYNKHLWFMISCGSSAVWRFMGSLRRHHTQPLTGMFPAFHSVSGHWYPIIMDLSPPTRSVPFFCLLCQQGK